MPPPQTITLSGRSYSVPVLNGEMDSIVEQMNSKRNEIISLNSHLRDANIELNNLQQQFLTIYIQQTGSFPS